MLLRLRGDGRTKILKRLFGVPVCCIVRKIVELHAFPAQGGQWSRIPLVRSTIWARDLDRRICLD